FDPVLPAASVAEHVMVLMPRGSVVPEPGTHVAAISPSTASAAVAAYTAAAPDGPAASTMKLAGTETAGAVVSWTVTSNESSARFPRLSIAEHVTGVVPSGKTSPDWREQFTATSPSTRSNAEASNTTTAPAGPVASAVMSSGTTSTGAPVSAMVT